MCDVDDKIEKKNQIMFSLNHLRKLCYTQYTRPYIKSRNKVCKTGRKI